MLRVRLERMTYLVDINFTPALFDWNPIPARFFTMVHSALPSDFTDAAQYFSVTTGNSLDEVSARYNILGGSDNIVLSARSLSMEFHEISSQMYAGMMQLIEDIETNFVIHFPECKYSNVEIKSFEHLTVLDEQSASDYLERYAIMSIDEAFGHGQFLSYPSARFAVSDPNDAWTANCMIERSHHFENSLFLHIRLNLRDVESTDTFSEKSSRIKMIVDACISTLRLETTNV